MATTAEIRVIYERLNRDLSDTVLGTELSTEMHMALAEIRSSVKEALSVLTDEPIRSLYTRCLVGHAPTVRQ